MVTYEHICNACEHEWEQVYGMTVDPPTLCPSCDVDGYVQRLISLGSGPGIMRKSTPEIRSSIASEQRKIQQKAATDENFRANLVGEDIYHEQKLNQDALTKELVKIGKKESAIKSTATKPSKVRPKIKSSKGKKK